MLLKVCLRGVNDWLIVVINLGTCERLSINRTEQAAMHGLGKISCAMVLMEGGQNWVMKFGGEASIIHLENFFKGTRFSCLPKCTREHEEMVYCCGKEQVSC